MKELECDIETRFERWCEAAGLVCEKLEMKSKRGWPDRTVSNGLLWCLVELKRPKSGELSPQQVAKIVVLLDKGVPVLVTDSFTEAVGFVVRTLELIPDRDGP